MEMTGLNPSTDLILEVAVVVTDFNLNILTQSPSFVIHQPDNILNQMDKWNTATHTKSGLIDKSKSSIYSLEYVEKELLKLVKPLVKKGQSPLCGNTIHQDRKFLVNYMANFETYLHYRNLDVSTLKELARRWYPDIYNGFKKHNKHEAIADILESIEELKYYRVNMLK